MTMKRTKTQEERIQHSENKQREYERIEKKLKAERLILQPFRILDIDDLFIMTSLLTAESLAAIAKDLKRSPSAITMRIKRYGDSFGDDFFISKRKQSGRLLSEKGRTICENAQKTLVFLLETKIF